MAPRSQSDRGPGVFMPYLYILKSLKDNNLYVGTCSNNLDTRIKKHNNGLVRSTKGRRPLKLVYKENFSTLSEARKQEWLLKYTPWGGKFKKELVSKAVGSSNGRTSPFGGEYLGSNPSPTALDTKRHKHT